MKAIQAHQFGDPEVVKYEEVPTPRPGAGEVLVRVRAAGVNPVDVAMLSGRHPAAKGLSFPFIPGFDVAGEVEALGDGVKNLKEGEAIFARARGGAYAEFARVPAAEAGRKPKNLSFEEAAATPIAFLTAWSALVHKAALQAGETVLVQGGGGGVGSAAIQVAKVLGARVITTVGSSEKARRAKEIGADFAIVYREKDFSAEVREITGGKGADVIIETVASENLQKDVEAISLWGRIVIIGAGTGKRPEAIFPVGPALFKDLHLYTTTLFNVPHLVPEMTQRLVALFEEGKMRPQVGSTFPLREAAKAHRALLEGKFFGKIVLSPIP